MQEKVGVGARRWLPLRALVVAALVPVLVIAAPHAAVAVGESAGPAQETHISSGDEVWQIPERVQCTVNWQWMTLPGLGPGITPPSSWVRFKAECSTGAFIASAMVSFQFRGLDDGLSDCVVASTAVEADGSDGWSGGAYQVFPNDGEPLVGTVEDGVGVPFPCDINEVCMAVDKDGHTDPTGPDSAVHCEEIAGVVTPPAPIVTEQATTCSMFDATRPTVDPAALIVGSSYRQQVGNSDWNMLFRSGSADGTFSAYVVVQSNDGIATNWATVGEGTGAPVGAQKYWNNALLGPLQVAYYTVTPTTGGTGYSWTFDHAMSKRNTWVSGTNPGVSGTVIGVGIIDRPSTGNAWEQVPQAIAGGRLGTTDPAVCSFYWGSKIASTVGDDTDEPAGPIIAPPPPDPPDDLPEPCGEGSGSYGEGSETCDPVPGACQENGKGFSIFDPSTWVGAAMCQLVTLFAKAVELLGKIFGAIVGLGATIAEAIADALAGIVGAVGDLLETLFIPSEETWEQTKDDLTLAWDESEATGWSDALSGATSQGSGVSGRGTVESTGCEGPTVSWDGFEKVGMPAAWQPLNACSGKASDMAYWSHLILTVIVVIGGGAKILEMFMVQLGIMKNTHTLVAHDWTGPNSGRF